ncbi:MAG TPA: hypothetical protein VER11_29805 [Polyangiaceae bacterium]|nr:hypothetical protein [Polyangiaceae bacterium]
MIETNKDGKDDGPRLPKVATISLAGIVVVGTVFYLWVAFFRKEDSAMWSNVGQAVGPFVALLNAGALFAALYSVRLQRFELELQRIELRGHREVMEEQRKQFERTAKAQEELVRAQMLGASASAIAALTDATGNLLDFLAKHETEDSDLERPIMYVNNLVDLGQILADLHTQALSLKVEMPNPLTNRLRPEKAGKGETGA